MQPLNWSLCRVRRRLACRHSSALLLPFLLALLFLLVLPYSASGVVAFVCDSATERTSSSATLASSGHLSAASPSSWVAATHPGQQLAS